MQYLSFTKDGLQVSQLGFGCMRFPILNNDSGQIDEDLATEMLHYGIDHGINYIDTAYFYHKGNSEAFVGKALRNGYREKVYLATKLPVWMADSYEDFEKYLDNQLERLETDYIDFYLLHALNKNSWNKSKDLGVLNFLQEAKEKGKIKYIGFSFHDEYEVFTEIVDSYPWDFCQIQLNYMDRQYQAGIAGLEYVAEKGISLVIMEPIKGGKLSTASKEIQSVWDESPVKRTPAEWALRWLYNFKEVGVVLSGMSTMEHVIENIQTSSETIPNSLTEEELNLINRVTKIYEEKTKVGCTSCEYCLPCPQNVSIPNIFEAYNNAFIYDELEASSSRYKKFIELEQDASKCIQCGICEGLCPQHLKIMESLQDAHRILA